MTIQWIDKILEDAVGTKFSGRLEINFFEGGVADVNKIERIKAPKEKRETQFTPYTAKALRTSGY